MTRAVFLDRDGVLNDRVLRNGQPTAPFSVDELRISRGVPEALGALRAAGLQVVDQPGPDTPWSPADRARMTEITDTLCARAEAARQSAMAATVATCRCRVITLSSS